MVKLEDQFEAWVLQEPEAENRADLISSLKERCGDRAIILDTCQRLEVYGCVDLTDLSIAERYNAAEAFERIVRIAAGLQSRVLGELEVLGQVRNAYKLFMELSAGNNVALDRIYQDALQLARRTRRDSGIDQQMTSLSGLTSRKILDLIPTGHPVAVIGSGSLAGSVVRYLAKRGDSPVRVSSRCPEKALELAATAGGFGAGLDQLSELLDGVHAIISATAAPHPVLFEHHLDQGDYRITVADLGVPADCADCIKRHQRVDYISLADMEAESMENQEERQRRADKAEAIVREGVAAWCARC